MDATNSSYSRGTAGFAPAMIPAHTRPFCSYRKGTGMEMHDEALWRSCERIAASLAIPSPWDFRKFLNIVGTQHGRKIELIDVASEPGKPCGLLVSTERTDYIFSAANTTALHQLHIRCHEIAHLLRGHASTGALDVDLTRLLMPSLPDSVIRRVLGRTAYSAEQEREAELLGSLIMRRIGHHPHPRRPATPAVADTVARLSSVFDHRPVGRHG